MGKKNILVLVFLLLLSIGLYYTCFHVNALYRNTLSEILGVDRIMVESETVLGAPLLKDAYYIEIYNLSDRNLFDFLQKKEKVFFLKEMDKTLDWTRVGWCKTPLDKKFDLLLRKAMSYGYKDKEIDSVLFEIRDVLASDNGYYAMYYKGNLCSRDLLSISHLLFFILDVKNSKLYIVDM